MRVLLVHNRYQQRGGEDAVVATENTLLQEHGVTTYLLEGDNDHIIGTAEALGAAVSAFHNSRAVKRLTDAITTFKPHIVHVHNWFPTLSPALFSACQRSGVPVVNTLHNYRLLCIKASLYRDGHPCEECIGKVLRLPGVAHTCYRESRLASIAATAMMVTHWQLGTWTRAVDRFIALSEFARNKLIEGGLPADRIAVKSNALDFDPGIRPGKGGYFAYVGRLTDEKGIPTVLAAWRQDKTLPQLKIIGGGPLEEEVRQAAMECNVEWLGVRSSEETLEFIGNASALICPSHWYEGMPRVAIEAMAVGTPVIASRLGTYIEMIDHGRNGMLFESADPRALAGCVHHFKDFAASAMRALAREQFELKYGGERNVTELLGIYRRVLGIRCNGEPESLVPLEAA